MKSKILNSLVDQLIFYHIYFSLIGLTKKKKKRNFTYVIPNGSDKIYVGFTFLDHQDEAYILYYVYIPNQQKVNF